MTIDLESQIYQLKQASRMIEIAMSYLDRCDYRCVSDDEEYSIDGIERFNEAYDLHTSLYRDLQRLEELREPTEAI